MIYGSTYYSLPSQRPGIRRLAWQYERQHLFSRSCRSRSWWGPGILALLVSGFLIHSVVVFTSKILLSCKSNIAISVRWLLLSTFETQPKSLQTTEFEPWIQEWKLSGCVNFIRMSLEATMNRSRKLATGGKRIMYRSRVLYAGRNTKAPAGTDRIGVLMVMLDSVWLGFTTQRGLCEVVKVYIRPQHLGTPFFPNLVNFPLLWQVGRNWLLWHPSVH